MGIDYSYNCTGATIVQDFGTIDGSRVLLCNLEFEDEHGHALAPVENAIVVLGNGYAELADCAERILGDSFENATDDEIAKWEALAEEGHPGYDVYNPEELAKMLTN